jgi:hypothetical protein
MPMQLIPVDHQAMLATIQKNRDAPVLPPIRATIVAGNNDVGIRISDQGVRPIVAHELQFIVPAQAVVFLSPQ